MRKSYPSDISRKQFEEICEELWNALLPGSTNVGDFGKTANANYRTLFESFRWPLFGSS